MEADEQKASLMKQELMKKCEVKSEEELDRLYEIIYRGTLSLNALVKNTEFERTEFIDLLENEDESIEEYIDKKNEPIKLKNYISNLNKKQQKQRVFEHFTNGKPYRTIAKEEGVSFQAVQASVLNFVQKARSDLNKTSPRRINTVSQKKGVSVMH